MKAPFLNIGALPGMYNVKDVGWWDLKFFRPAWSSLKYEKEVWPLR